MQKSLLFHSLREENDQGFLQVECTLNGDVDFTRLKNAFQKTVLRHPALRASIHWEEIEKPVSVIHAEAPMPWKTLDWTGFSVDDQQKKKVALKVENKKAGFDLAKAPVSRIHLIQIEQSTYWLIWSCHHILLDGWSSAIIMKDAFDTYNSLIQNENLHQEALPAYKSYLKWLASQDLDSAEKFWKNRLADLKESILFGLVTSEANGKNPAFEQKGIHIPLKKTNQLKSFLVKNRVTLSSFFHSIWGLLLSVYARESDIVFGSTVSGRPSQVRNIDLMSGLFMNVIPARIKIETDSSISVWLQKVQSELLEAQQFSFVTLNQMIEWSNSLTHTELFDSLLVIENFPWKEMKYPTLSVDQFKSGITTTYPLTCIVISGDQLKIELRYDQRIIPDQLISWFESGINLLIDQTITPEERTVGQIISTISNEKCDIDLARLRSRQKSENQIKFSLQDFTTDYIAPENPAELKLTKIWEKVLDRQPIGVTENFFEIGGKSMHAIRLFALIENKMNLNLPPIMLLKHSTIRSMAKAIEAKSELKWASLVPFRASGSKPPLFCVHAGGGHVFFYNALARRLGHDQPVYSLQPKGLDGVESKHESIEEMAAHYCEEMVAVYPEGPFVLLSTCNGNAVCLEIARQLINSGRKILDIFIIDSAPKVLDAVPHPSVQLSANRYIDLIRKGDLQGLARRIPVIYRTIRRKWDHLMLARQEKNLAAMQQRIVSLNRDYTWKPYTGKVTLIRSTEFNSDPLKDYHIPHWQELAAEGLEVHVVESTHDAIFEEPDVQNLAQQLAACLIHTNQPA